MPSKTGIAPEVDLVSAQEAMGVQGGPVAWRLVVLGRLESLIDRTSA
jgi:hypothetical protein